MLRTRRMVMHMGGHLALKRCLDVLGVRRNASPVELKAAYYKRVKQCHPDLNPSDEAMQEFLLLTEVST